MLRSSFAEPTRFMPRGGVAVPAAGRAHDLGPAKLSRKLDRWRD